MKLGIISATFREFPFEEFLDFAKGLGIQAIEYGGFSFEDHFTLEELATEKSKREELLKNVKDRDMFISALNAPAINVLHPNKETAKDAQAKLRKVFEVANLLGVDRVVAMAGLPGLSSEAVEPGWVPMYAGDLYEKYEWQWKERVIPIWRDLAEHADKNKVKICIELHPYQAAYNPSTLLRLREEVGEIIGVNLDPSHLFWQGMSIPEVIKILGSAIYHTHMKDIRIDPIACAQNGFFNPQKYTDFKNRSWIPCIVGYGHDMGEWKAIISTLQSVGYNYVLSIEHEDVLFPIKEGVEKEAHFLKNIMIEGNVEEKIWF